MDHRYATPKTGTGSSHSAAARRRAPKACLSCRSRKVRCDVMHHDGRCTNCVLDSKECVVKPRPAKYRSSKSTSAIETGLSAGAPAASFTVQDRQQGQCQDQQERPSDAEKHNASRTPSTQSLASDCGPTSAGTSAEIVNLAPSHDIHARAEATLGDGSSFAMLKDASDWHFRPTSLKSIPNSSLSIPDERGNCPLALNGHVIYSSLPFLTADLSLMSEHDLHFLDTQGCFKVPDRNSIDEFVREYFLHVHPALPLLDESEFWAMYSRSGPYHRQPTHLSLFLFQAMLFASCSFLSPKTVRQLGFTATRNARSTYYRRAKLLFDFGAEADLVANAQGALLLSYNASMRDQKRANSSWLWTAIQLAQNAGAHVSFRRQSQDKKKVSALKRLWWCCLVRDRILPLGQRRQACISMDSFDATRMVLTEEDFEDEVEASLVYDARTKRSLVQLFLTLCELAISLTEVIKIMYPRGTPIDISDFDASKLRRHFKRVQACQLGLQTWFDRATTKFPTPAGIMGTNESLILYINLMYIYYHSAQLAISQHEALILVMRRSDILEGGHDPRRSQNKVEDASARITEYIKELIQLKLGRYLPISVVAYAAVPLVLHLMDVSLSATPSQAAQKQGRLNIYIEAMKRFKTQYDGTDEVCSFVDTVLKNTSQVFPPRDLQRPTNINLTDIHGQLDSHTRTLCPGTTMETDNATGWGHMLMHSPTVYFRITHTIDLSLSIGHYPEDSDFPLMLKSIRFHPILQVPKDKRSEKSFLQAAAQNNLDSGFMPGHGGLGRADGDDEDRENQLLSGNELIDYPETTGDIPCLENAEEVMAILPDNMGPDFGDWGGYLTGIPYHV